MDDQFLKVAKQAALEAGKVIKKYAGKTSQKNVKHGDMSDFATEADIEAEKTIVSIISKAFPKHNIIAEENERTHQGSEYTWVIDPLDGSFTFGQNIPYFTVSIGLLKHNKPVLGVVNHVGFNNLYWAAVGGGAFLNGKLIQVSGKKNLDEVAAVLDFGHRKGRQNKLDLYINSLISKIGYPYSFGSAVVSLILIAEGILDLNVNQAYLWDFVAGVVIIREAGGKVTDFEGMEPDWIKERLNIVASNGLIHEQILKELR
ncbi:inositol monophosphatase [Candidatus Daviesbacteria bacterium]|nr:inositol monophosphatase [Candidatus Daviesbacteria bacterium]